MLEVVERIKREGWDQFSNRHGDWGRDMVFFLARPAVAGGMTLKQLGERADSLDSWAVSKGILRFEARLEKDPELRELLALANSQLSKVPI